MPPRELNPSFSAQASAARGPVLRLALLLLATDLGFLALHLMHVLSPWFNDPGFNVATERGFGEVYQYIKLFWIAGWLVLLSRRRSHALALLVWAVVFLVALADDAMQLHERAGWWVRQNLAPTPRFGLRPEDLGEIGFAAVVGGLLLGLVMVGHLLSDRWTRQISWRLLVLLAALAFFGVVADAVHVAIFPGDLFALVEDGGEMLVVTAALAYLVSLDAPAQDHLTDISRLPSASCPQRSPA